MIIGLDHVVVLVRDIEVGVAACEKLLALQPAWRSSHDGAATAIFTLDNMSVELMAPRGHGADADRVRAAIDGQGEGLASVCFRTDDIARMHRRLERLALKPEPIADAESTDEVTGAKLAWRRTRAATEATRGVRQFFIKLNGERPRSRASGDAPFTGLDHVVVSTGNPERAAALYGARLGLGMALDRSHPEWGQLMFFRCGDLIVEVTHRPGGKTDPTNDGLRGLCWRVDDADATRARLVSEGIDVSEVRTGRKPGTRVMTVRDGTLAVPTLLVERTPRPSQ